VPKQPLPQESSEQPDRYVVVVHGLFELEDVLAEMRLLEGLDAEIPGGSFSVDIAVPRSRAREAYLRILRSPYRDLGLLVEWKD
jgi:hypothetical protein